MLDLAGQLVEDGYEYVEEFCAEFERLVKVLGAEPVPAACGIFANLLGRPSSRFNPTAFPASG